MGLAVHRFELFDAHLGVNRCRFKLLVAKELLDETDVGPTLEHVSRAGVPQEMTRAGAPDLSLFDEFGHHPAQDIRIEGFAVAGQKEGFLEEVQHKTRARFLQVSFQPFQGSFSHGDDSILMAFPLSDLQRLAFAIQVG